MNSITLLGSGDTLGSPVPGCYTTDRLDSNPKSKRYRFGVYLQLNGTNILIDPNPDIKWQMLANNIHPKHIDHIFTTHQHSDHVNGLGEFFYRRENPTRLWYGDNPLNEKLIEYWRYLERENVLKFNKYNDFDKLKLSNGVSVTPIELNHGFPASGFVVSDGDVKIGIVTDTNALLSKATLKELNGVDYLFADTFSENLEQVKGVYRDCNIETPDLDKDWYHMTISEVIDLHIKLNSKKTYTVHMSRFMSPHSRLVEKYEKDDFIIGYDGLTITI